MQFGEIGSLTQKLSVEIFAGGVLYDLLSGMEEDLVTYFIVSGVKVKGIGYFKHYFQPIWFMTPFNMLEDVVRPLTLALRLFANILAGHLIIMVLMALIFIITISMGAVVGGVTAVVSILFSIFMYCLELLVAFIQAYVFTLLSAIYFGMAAKHD